MGTDFFDEDLVKDERQSGLPLDAKDEVPVRELNSRAIGRLVEQKEERSTRVAGTVEEIERLRMRQLELEREKTELEQLTRKQVEYEKAKRDVIGKLEKHIVLLDKQAVEAARVGDLVATIRARFQETLKDITGIIEEDWPADRFEVELGKAMVRVEEAQSVHRKGISKVRATNWFRDAGDETAAPETTVALPPSRPGVGYWLKAGLAFALPLILTIAACFVAWLFLTGVV